MPPKLPTSLAQLSFLSVCHVVVVADLSFNNLEKIEGLTALVKLEDLILFNNRIEVISNIDSLERLQVLSIGNNSISELESVRWQNFLSMLQLL